jgi:hypothetical protein
MDFKPPITITITITVQAMPDVQAQQQAVDERGVLQMECVWRHVLYQWDMRKY